MKFFEPIGESVVEERTAFPLRIGFFTGTLSVLAGAERACVSLANALAQRGHTVSILAQWGRVSVFPLEETIRFKFLHPQKISFRRNYISTVLELRKWIKKQELDVLIDVDTNLTWFSLPARRGLNVKSVAWEHCHFDQDLGLKQRQWARRWAAKKDQSIVVLTEKDATRWQEALAPQAIISTIPNPLSFPCVKNISSAQKRERVFLAVGRLEPVKGFDRLIEAFALARIRYGLDWTLRIVGKGSEEDYLHHYIKLKNLTACVEICDATPNIIEHYQRAGILVMSSHYEGFGLVLLEAMATGCPVMAFDVDHGPRSLITHTRTGYLILNGHLDAMAAAMQELARDNVLREQLGRQGWLFAKNYEPSQIAKLWESALKFDDTVTPPSNTTPTQQEP